MVGRRLAWAGALVAALALTGCAEPDDGDDAVRAAAAREAEALKDRLGHRTRVRDAEHIAATEIATVERAQLIPVRWSGRTVGSEQATIDVRIGADRCYRYVLQLYRYTEYAEIDCPAPTDVLPVPSAAPIPQVPGDAPRRLTEALRDATTGTLDDVVRTAFPESHLHIDTATDGDGTLVATVGVPAERDCLLMVKRPDGTVESPGYDRIWLEPGELGCNTRLFTAPPR